MPLTEHSRPTAAVAAAELLAAKLSYAMHPGEHSVWHLGGFSAAGMSVLTEIDGPLITDRDGPPMNA